MTVTDSQPRPQRRDPRGGRSSRRRVPGHRVSRRQRLAPGQRRRPALAVETAVEPARVRPQPGGAQPRHPPERLDRRRHHRADRAAVQRSVLPAPAPRDQPAARRRDLQLVLLMPRHPGRHGQRTADYLDRGPRRRRAARQPPRRRSPAEPRRRRAASRRPRRPARRGTPASATSTSTTAGRARACAGHLIAGGRRVIATIAGPTDMVAGIDRLAGYRDALDDAGRRSTRP